LSQHFLYNPLKGQQPLQKPKQNNTKKPAQKQQHIKNKEYQKTSYLSHKKHATFFNKASLEHKVVFARKPET
jgi:hypothetical protein